MLMWTHLIPSMACALTSGMTRGTPSVILNALLLSTTCSGGSITNVNDLGARSIVVDLECWPHTCSRQLLQVSMLGTHASC